MTDTPLNPDALEKASREVFREVRGFDKSQSTRVARRAIAAYLATAQPVVNSVEELDALPPHTVIEEHEQGHGVLIKRGPRSWECLTHYVSGLPSGDIDLPDRVLYRPEVDDA